MTADRTPDGSPEAGPAPGRSGTASALAAAVSRRSRFRSAPRVGWPGRRRAPTLRPLRDLRLPSALQNAPFRHYWLSQVVALAGTWMQSVGTQLVVLSLTTSAIAIGAINVVAAVPMLLFSLSGGVIADKFDRRHILIITMSLLGVLSLIYAWLIWTGALAYWHILVLAAVAGIIASFQLPASQAFVAELVPMDDLPEAIALNSASFNSTRIVGPALAATAIGALGLASAFIVNAFTLLAPIGTLVRIRKFLKPRQAPRVRASGMSALRDGVRYVRANDGLWGLVLLQAALSFFVSPNLLVLLPLYTTDVLGGSDSWVGLMLSAMGVGSLTGALVLLRGSKLEVAQGQRMKVSVIGLTAGLAWIALSTSPWMAVPGVMVAGYAFSSGNSQLMTRVQQIAPEELRGRVLSIVGLAFNGVMPFATIIVSVLSQVVGQPIVMGLSGALLGLSGLYLWRRYVWQAFLPAEAPEPGVARAL